MKLTVAILVVLVLLGLGVLIDSQSKPKTSSPIETQGIGETLILDIEPSLTEATSTATSTATTTLE